MCVCVGGEGAVGSGVMVSFVGGGGGGAGGCRSVGSGVKV